MSKNAVFSIQWMGSFVVLLLLLSSGACSYTLKIKDGKTAHERKQFATAIPLLEKEYARAKTRKEKGQLAYLLGDSYIRSGKDAQALPWFEAATANGFGLEALKAKAYTLKKLEKYTEASEAFKNLGNEIGSPYEYRRDITACTVAEAWKAAQKNNGWSLENLPFNSPQNDFGGGAVTGLMIIIWGYCTRTLYWKVLPTDLPSKWMLMM